MKNLGRRGIMAAGAALAVAPAARAQGAYPDRPVKFVVGFPAGGATDVVGRLLGQRVGELLGKQIVVENKPGAAATSVRPWSRRRNPTAIRCWSAIRS